MNKYQRMLKIREVLIMIILLISSIIFFSYVIKLKLNHQVLINNGLSKMDHYFSLNHIFNKDLFLNYAFNITQTDESPNNYLGDYISDYGYNDTLANIDIYLYNTHQTESYSYQKVNEYNINETVLLASYLLREKLRNENLNCYVETTNISDILKNNNWKYKYSYQASRLLIEEFLKNHDPGLIIDLHRDSGSYEKTTVNINGKNYAKVLFVVGGKNPGFEANLTLANQLNDLIKEIAPLLSRGITLKNTPNVNGIYNQDLSPKMILIEIGGEYNTIAEVSNTLDIISKVLSKYLNGTQEE